MREDVLQYGAHVRFVPLSQVDYTFVIVSCVGEKEMCITTKVQLQLTQRKSLI